MILKEGTLLQGGNYKIVRHIASGGFGNTYEALYSSMDNTHVAIKEFFVKDFCFRNEKQEVVVTLSEKQSLFQKMKELFMDEALAIFCMRHDNIVRVYDRFEENGTSYYVMEYVEGESLQRVLDKKKTLPEDESLRYIKQIADALSYVHSMNRFHLDVKPANIMIGKNNQAILIDFGASKYYDESKDVTTITMPGLFSPCYAPFEQTVPGIKHFTAATDIYAIAATMYRMLSGNTPPAAGLMLAKVERLPSLSSIISQNTRNAIEQAMNPERHKRPQRIEEFLHILNGDKKNLSGTSSNSTVDTIYQTYDTIIDSSSTSSPNYYNISSDITENDFVFDQLPPEEIIIKYQRSFSRFISNRPIRSENELNILNRAITVYESFPVMVQGVIASLYNDLKEKQREAKEYYETREKAEDYHKDFSYILNKSIESIREGDIPLLKLALTTYENHSDTVRNRIGIDIKSQLIKKIKQGEDYLQLKEDERSAVKFLLDHQNHINEDDIQLQRTAIASFEELTSRAQQLTKLDVIDLQKKSAKWLTYCLKQDPYDCAEKTVLRLYSGPIEENNIKVFLAEKYNSLNEKDFRDNILFFFEEIHTALLNNTPQLRELNKTSEMLIEKYRHMTTPQSGRLKLSEIDSAIYEAKQLLQQYPNIYGCGVKLSGFLKRLRFKRDLVMNS